VNGKTVSTAKAGKSAVIAARSGKYTVGVKINYKSGEIIESSSKCNGSHTGTFKWKVA
jgi:hypothetical protein